MASVSNLHWEALTPATLQAFKQVETLPFIGDFYLAGGSGLALHLGHRFSIDLDFFSSSPSAVGPEQRDALRILLHDPLLNISYDSDGTFVATWHAVGISFFRLPLYQLVQVPLLLGAVLLATIAEIGAMKLAAIIGRGTRKDLVDLYFILQTTSIEELFRVAAIKYAHNHSFPVSALRAMAYFKDAEALPMPQMLDPTPWSKMKKYLEAQAMEAGRMKLSDLWKS